MCFMVGLGLLVIGTVGFIGLLFCMFSVKAYHDEIADHIGEKDEL